MVKYRSDIDGLRAIAVGGVVLFHALPWSLTGGFVGVDVFFVLSGYLITSIICGEARRGEFSILRFYERRFRRIMPALILMTIATTVASLLILAPRELEDFGRSLFGVATFTANIIFWMDTGYFAPDAIDKPLLHTWSLAVEEQFYIVWPFVAAMLARRENQTPLRVFVVVTVLASLALSIIGVRLFQEFTFYMLPTRAWELGLGAMLAVGAVPAIRSQAEREAVAVLGILLIAGSMVLYSEAVPFPGPYALAPCLGAVCIIHAGDQAKTLVGRALSAGPVLYVGLISYSFYLWHWPVLVLPRLALNRHLTITEAVAAIVVAFLLAALSTKYVEARFRGRGTWQLTRNQVLGISVGAATAIGAVGLVFVKTDGLFQFASPAVQMAEHANDDINPRRPACHAEQAGASGKLGDVAKCVSGKSDATQGYDVLLWGDSHADHLMPGIEAIADQRNLEVRQATVSRCSPVSQYIAYVPHPPACAKIYRTALKEAAAQKDLDAVVISSSWAAVLPKIYNTVGHHSVAETERLFAGAVRSIVGAVRKEVPNAQLVVVGTTPEFDVVPPKCFARDAKLGVDDTDCAARVPTDAEWGPRADRVITGLIQDGVTVVLPRRAFCHGKLCETRLNGKILYYDDDHLSVAGSKVAAPIVMAGLKDS